MKKVPIRCSLWVRKVYDKMIYRTSGIHMGGSRRFLVLPFLCSLLVRELLIREPERWFSNKSEKEGKERENLCNGTYKFWY